MKVCFQLLRDSTQTKEKACEKNQNMEKLGRRYSLDPEGSLKKSTTLPRYHRNSASPIYELCDIAKLTAQCLNSLICRMGTVLVPIIMP